MNPLPEGKLDLLLSLSDPGEDDLRRVAAGFEHAEQFTAGNDVKARARPPQAIAGRSDWSSP